MIDLAFFYPYNPAYMIIVLIVALMLDYLYPFHKGLLLRIHPVHTSFILARMLGKKYSSKLRGILTWIFVVSIHIVLYSLILYVSWRISIYLWIAISAYILKLSFSLRLLLDIIGNIQSCLLKGDLDGARRWTQIIVRRDVYELDKPHVISAAIESLGESIVDGFISPLFWYMFLGPIGALMQRLANTMDSALGYKTPEYIDVGWFSAKIDTIINYVPARITALLYLVICLAYRNCNLHRAYMIWRKYHGATESFNAGHPISALAGLIGARLEKPGHYNIGVEHPLPGSRHLYLARIYTIGVTMSWLVIVNSGIILISTL